MGDDFLRAEVFGFSRALAGSGDVSSRIGFSRESAARRLSCTFGTSACGGCARARSPARRHIYFNRGFAVRTPAGCALGGDVGRARKQAAQNRLPLRLCGGGFFLGKGLRDGLELFFYVGLFREKPRRKVGVHAHGSGILEAEYDFVPADKPELLADDALGESVVVEKPVVILLLVRLLALERVDSVDKPRLVEPALYVFLAHGNPLQIEERRHQNRGG